MKKKCIKSDFLRSNPRNEFFKALACEKRILIIKTLKNNEMNINTIAIHLNLDTSLISRHLAILRNTGIIQYRREGVNIYVSITDKKIFKILDSIDIFLSSIINSKY